MSSARRTCREWLRGIGVNLRAQAWRRYSHPVDRNAAQVIRDQTGMPTVFNSTRDYPAALRRVVVRDDTGRRIDDDVAFAHSALQPELQKAFALACSPAGKDSAHPSGSCRTCLTDRIERIHLSFP